MDIYLLAIMSSPHVALNYITEFFIKVSDCLSWILIIHRFTSNISIHLFFPVIFIHHSNRIRATHWSLSWIWCITTSNSSVGIVPRWSLLVPRWSSWGIMFIIIRILIHYLMTIALLSMMLWSFLLYITISLMSLLITNLITRIEEAQIFSLHRAIIGILNNINNTLSLWDLLNILYISLWLLILILKVIYLSIMYSLMTFSLNITQLLFSILFNLGHFNFVIPINLILHIVYLFGMHWLSMSVSWSSCTGSSFRVRWFTSWFRRSSSVIIVSLVSLLILMVMNNRWFMENVWLSLRWVHDICRHWLMDNLRRYWYCHIWWSWVCVFILWLNVWLSMITRKTISSSRRRLWFLNVYN